MPAILLRNRFSYHAGGYDEYKNSENKGMIVHHLPVGEKLVDVKILMPDGDVVSGVGESNLRRLKKGDVIQAERIGFMRLDSIDKNLYVFCFAHR